MSDVLLTFGDSWPYGAQIQDKSKRFPVLLADKLGMDLLDLSKNATSIDHVVMAFFNFLENDYNPEVKYTALFCLTDISRALAWRPMVSVPPRDELWVNDSTTLELQVGNTVDELSQVYFKQLHSPRLEIFVYHKNIVLLKLLCEKYNITDFYAHNFYDPNLEFRIVNRDRISPITLTQLLNTKMYKEVIPDHLPGEEKARISRDLNDKNLLIQHGGHPSVAGHQVLADKLFEWILNERR